MKPTERFTLSERSAGTWRLTPRRRSMYAAVRAMGWRYYK